LFAPTFSLSILSLYFDKIFKKVSMENNKLSLSKVINILNEIMEYELAGVVRYTHYSLMVVGPHRLPIVQFLKDQANESLLHAQQAGELLTGLEGHPSQKIAEIVETNNHSIKDILQESLAHEVHALGLYKELLQEVEGSSIYLEEYARSLIGQEEQHQLELKKMLKDFS
jgi:bacterioferritin